MTSPFAPPDVTSAAPPFDDGADGPPRTRLTAGWWLGLVLLWVGYLVALAYIAGTAEFVGTPPWWTKAYPALFAIPVAGLLSAALGQPWARWVSTAGASALLVIGLLDLRTSPGVAVPEIVIAVGALLISAGSLVDDRATTID